MNEQLYKQLTGMPTENVMQTIADYIANYLDWHETVIFLEYLREQLRSINEETGEEEEEEDKIKAFKSWIDNEMTQETREYYRKLFKDEVKK